jgi:hypothetical protein
LANALLGESQALEELLLKLRWDGGLLPHKSALDKDELPEGGS